MVTKADHIRICMEEGLTEGEEAWLIAGKPVDIDLETISEETIRGACNLIQPLLALLRSLPNHEEKMSSYLTKEDNQDGRAN